MSDRPTRRHRALSRRPGYRTDRIDEGPEPSPAPAGADCCRSDPGGEESEASHTRLNLHFDRKVLERDRSELPAPGPASAQLLDLLGDLDDLHPSVLDLGCGDGAGAIRLLQAGARSVTGIDLSHASIEIARRRVLRTGMGRERTRFCVADVASVDLQPHDWLLLDRVICCYGDADRLVGNALTAEPRRLAFSVPESRGWRGVFNAIGWGLKNLWKVTVSPDRCRGYVHDVNRIEHHLEAAGFRRLRSGHRGLWYAAVFERGTSPAEDTNRG